MTYPVEKAVENELLDRGHEPLAVSLLVYGADDLTERLAHAPADLAEAYLHFVDGGRTG